MTQLEKLKVRLEIAKEDKTKDELLTTLLEDAQSEILDYCNRDALPTRAEGLQRDLTIIYYNRQGSEGEASRSEGGVSVSYEIPSNIKDKLKAYRRLKAVRLANEN